VDKLHTIVRTDNADLRHAVAVVDVNSFRLISVAINTVDRTAVSFAREKD